MGVGVECVAESSEEEWVAPARGPAKKQGYKVACQGEGKTAGSERARHWLPRPSAITLVQTLAAPRHITQTNWRFEMAFRPRSRSHHLASPFPPRIHLFASRGRPPNTTALPPRRAEIASRAS